MEKADQLKETLTMAQKAYETAIEYLIRYGFQMLGAVIILGIGFYVSGVLARLFENFCKKKNLDITLTHFLAGILRVVVMVFTGLMAVEKLGVTISPLIASVSALIFGASFAIQAPLSNYAAGLTVILTRPFVVGNTIAVQGVAGIVEEVKLACTILRDENGEKITIPNKDIVGQILHNSAAYKVVVRTVGISYKDDPEKAVRLICGILEKNAKVAKKPAPQVGVDQFGSSSIDISVRYWAPTQDYYPVLHEVNLAIYKELQAAQITIPFPQQEVRILSK